MSKQRLRFRLVADGYKLVSITGAIKARYCNPEGYIRSIELGEVVSKELVESMAESGRRIVTVTL